MTLFRIYLLRSAFLAAIFAATSSAVFAQQVTLKIHHFLGPNAPQQRVLVEPWAKNVMEQSKGRIKVEIYPRMGLGGKPPDLINQVIEGKVDIVWTLPGYTPGKFPRVEVFELPFIHRNDPVATNLAILSIYDKFLAEDFKEVYPLLLHVHAGAAFHMVDQPIRSISDVRGKKIRTPSRTGGWMLQALGATPVGMPVPAVPGALSNKTIDGALIPFEVTLPLKVHELTTSSTEGALASRFGTSVFLFAMNRKKYESLPIDLRAVIDRNSGITIAADMGKAWAMAEVPGRNAARDRGNDLIVLPQIELERFREATESVTNRWIAEVTSLGINGANLVEAAQKAVAQHRWWRER